MGQRQVVLCGEGPENSRQPGTCAQPSQAWEPGCCNLGFAPNRELQGGYEAAWSGPSRNAGLWAALPACTTDGPRGDAVRVLSPAVKTGALKQPPPPGPSGLPAGGNRGGVWPLERVGEEESALMRPCVNSVPGRVLAED